MRDAGLVVRDGDHCSTIFLHQRQHPFQAFFLARHRVHQRLALVDGQSGFECRNDRRIDAQRHIGDRLHQLDRLRQDARLIGQRNAGVDIEHMGAGRDLRMHVGHHPAEIAGRHLCGQNLAAGRVDALADDDEGPLEADDDFPGGGTDNGICHDMHLGC